MKNTLLILMLLVTINSFSQEKLDNKIPNNAQFVVGVDGERLLELMTLDEFNNLSFIKKILKNKELNNLEDLGFNLNQEAYYFNQFINERYYNSFIVYLSDSKKFETFLNTNDEIETINGFNFITRKKFGVSWNNKMLIITTVSGFENIYYYDDVIEEDAVFEEFKEEDNNNIEEKKDIEEVEVIEEEIVEDVEIVEEVEKDNTKSANNSTISRSEKNKKDKIQLKELLKNQVFSIIATNSINSIAKNKNYKAGKDSKSSAYFWLKDYSDSMMKILEKYPSKSKGLFSKSLIPKDVFGITSVNSNLFFNKDEIKLTGEISLTKEMEKRFEKTYRSKLDCSFFKYFNQDEVLAYMGYSINMKAMLDEYPRMVKDVYGSIFPKYEEEISAFADLTSVFLDEKAIAELITGDALFILNDITEQETSYTTYEYDNDYNREEVTKTKNETLPIFTIMIGSENEELITKLVRLGIKHKVVEENNRVFKFSKKSSKSPFDLYFVIQDDIAFITNSESQIEKISKKKIKRKTGKHKRLLRKNLLSFYINSDKLIEHLPTDKFGNKNKNAIGLVKDDFKEMQFSYSRIKHGKFNIEQTIKTKGKSDNSLKTLFNLIEELSHL